MENYGISLGVVGALLGIGLPATGLINQDLGWVITILALVIFCASTDVFLKNRGQQKTPAKINKNELLNGFKELATTFSNSEISYAEISQQPKVETIVGLLEKAGWSTNYNKIPLGTHMHTYFEGIEVSGYNRHTVDSFAKVLTDAGFVGVRVKLKMLGFGRDNPKYPYAQDRADILFGYESLATFSNK